MTQANAYPLEEVRERYRFLGKLGAGGMADVYLGVQSGAEDFKRLVVIKRIRAARVGEVDDLRMLIDEAQLVATLSHPHIVKIFDLSRLGDDLCIAMEYIDGESLAFIQRAAFADKTPVPVPIVCKMMIEAAEALDYAHKACGPDGTPLRIIHRDIGPQNLLTDRHGYLKVIDFGIAKSAVQTELTSPGMFRGKLPYIAPDVFTHTTLDGRSDIYSLGLVFYEMLTLQLAFPFGKDVTIAEVMRRKTEGALPPPSSLVPGLDLAVDAVVAAATHPSRDERLPTGEAFAAAIGEVAQRFGGLPSTAQVSAWFNERFKERIAKRRELERRVMLKATQSTTDSHRFQPDDGRQELETSRSYDSSRIGLWDESLLSSGSIPFGTSSRTAPGAVPRSKRANPYILAVVIFALFLGGAGVVRFLFWGDRADAEQTGSVQMIVDNLYVRSVPPGAEIWIDDERVGNTGSTGLNLRVEPGKEYSLSVRLDGYRDYTIKFIGEASAQRQVDAILTAIDAPEKPEELAQATDDSQPHARSKDKRWRRRGQRRAYADEAGEEGAAAESSGPEDEQDVDTAPEENASRAKASAPTPASRESGGGRQPQAVAQGAATASPATTSSVPQITEPKTYEAAPVVAAATLPPPAPPPPPVMVPKGPVAQSSSTLIHRRISGKAPDYPRDLRARGIEGTVEVTIVIGADGKVRKTEIVSGERALRDTVIEAVQTWRFRPHLVAGQPVETTGTLRFGFHLD